MSTNNNKRSFLGEDTSTTWCFFICTVMVIFLKNVTTLYWTHRHHSESCVDNTGSNGGVDGLLDPGFLEDTSRVVKYLNSTTINQKIGHKRVNFHDIFLYFWCGSIYSMQMCAKHVREKWLFLCVFFRTSVTVAERTMGSCLGLDTYSVDARQLLGELQDHSNNEGLAVEGRA